MPDLQKSAVLVLTVLVALYIDRRFVSKMIG
jgi:hypothetical protein